MRNVRSLVSILLTLSLLTGCAGRTAYPVARYQPGDENKDCQLLVAEMAQVETEIRKKAPHTDKSLQNVLCAAGGVLVIVPFFFMDLENADKIEVEALQARYNYLYTLASSKDCNLAESGLVVASEIKEDSQMENTQSEEK